MFMTVIYLDKGPGGFGYCQFSILVTENQETRKNRIERAERALWQSLIAEYIEDESGDEDAVYDRFDVIAFIDNVASPADQILLDA